MQTSDIPKIKTSTKGPVAVGLGIVAFLVVVIGVWGGTAPLASAIIANGQLKVDTNRKQIQHLDGGVVTEVLAYDGKMVKAGETLVILDPVQAKASFGIVEGALFTASLNKVRLQAERDSLPAPDFSAFDKYDASDKQSLIDAQLSLFNIRQSVQLSQKEILNKQISNLNEQIVGYQSQREATQKQITISKDELENLKSLKARGLVGNERVLELERNLAQLEGRDGELLSLAASARSSIDEKRLELIRVQRSYNEQVLAELQEIESQIMDLQERTNAASHTLKQMIVRAPVDGTVVGLSVHTIGGVIVPGQLLMEIVPADDQLIIEGQVSPSDVDDVMIGLNARIKLSGLQQRTTPELEGTVKYVSADSFTDERSGQAYFLVRVEVTAAEIAKLTEDQLIPGMPAEVFIKTGERTALQYLMQPLTDTIDRAWRES